MNTVAKFEKVSYDQFVKDMEREGDYTKIVHYNIQLPTRATKDSAGYDFKSPVDFTLNPGETITVKTGIRCKIDPGYFLMIAPRSGLGFKYRVQLDNTVGIIDGDYYNSDNEGHIMIKLTNDSKTGKVLIIKAGDGIAQGIFVPYGITIDDEATGVRNGGFGSTDK